MSGQINAIFQGSACEAFYACRCVDISPRGIAVDCPEPLSPEMIIQLQGNDGGAKRFARVIHCLPRGPAYRVGLEFIAVS
jgi:hypothetical protein